ncbi:MAG TPA: 16S rRNA (uracil(1498)-N(3))-methyltransferase, partial [Porticoccaceae bacterium]|nr:16S rRNA (uracil(1498)-N(3))-methyltransferase [Porticoccaceae bacterium]
MNLLLLRAQDLDDENRATVRGRRFEHITNVIKPAVGDTLKAGL